MLDDIIVLNGQRKSAKLLRLLEYRQMQPHQTVEAQ
jgi:hypothetical protein